MRNAPLWDSELRLLFNEKSGSESGSHVDNVIQADKLVHTTIYELKHVY